MQDHILHTIALTCIPKLSRRLMLEIYKHLGDTATPLFVENKESILSQWHDISHSLLDVILSYREMALSRATQEMEFVRKNKIQCLCYGKPDYPQRLQECEDAPLVLYYKGNADLNSPYTVCMVGTRKCTEYGKDLCRLFTDGLGRLRPDTLIVSGLAYGIDIHCHKGALENGMKTVAVLAHGLDRIYPYSHGNTAKRILQQGGLLTEYMSGTTPERGNFVSRNRIVAGLSDACIVVESAAKGGSLITAKIAQDYGRDILAVPGRPNDPYSEGCNKLIQDNIAALIMNPEDILRSLNWPSINIEREVRSQSVETNLFGCLSDEEKLLVQLLQKNDGKQINQLVVESNLPVFRVSAILFDLEMKGVVRLLAGGRYHLIG